MPVILRESMPPPGMTSGALGRVASAALAGATGFALTLNGFFMTFNSARFVAVTAALLALHLARFPRFIFLRESWLFAVFFAYLLLQLLWTDDRPLALNTIVPSLGFLITLMLVGSLAAFHDLRAVLTGLLLGCVAAAVAYTISSGFPFRYPAEFSYNAIAGMYLFGLFISLLLLTSGRFRLLLLGVASALMILILATTSIKVNLGILAGVLGAAIVYFGQFAALLRRYLILFILLVAGAGYVIGSNQALVETMRHGLERVALGIEVLKARENVPGYSGFEKRSEWLEASIEGWVENPLFGHGVEAFRARFGATSHSTAVDLLHNSGLIGLFLFYGLFASLLRRLYVAEWTGAPQGKIVIFGSIVCYFFISLAAPIHYQGTFAAVVAVCAVMLARNRRPPGDDSGGSA